MRRRCAFVWLVLGCGIALGACRGNRVQVLDDPDAGALPTIDSCEMLFESMGGEACTGPEMGCERRVGCVVETAFCELGRVLRASDATECQACEQDEDCGFRQWCVPPGMCWVVDECHGDYPGCSPELLPFIRNGCHTGVCLPPSECREARDCGPTGEFECQIDHCVCEHDPDCCVGHCVPADCRAPEPSPEGCGYECPEEEARCPSGFCRRIGCECVGDRWECDMICTEDRGPYYCVP